MVIWNFPLPLKISIFLWKFLRSSYQIPSNLISLDGDASDWELVPQLAAGRPAEYSGDLRRVHSAVDEDQLYLLLESAGNWDTKRNIVIEIDGGDGVDRSLIIEKRKIQLQLGDSEFKLDCEVKQKGSYWEASIPIEEIGDNLEYINLKKIVQEEGSVYPIIPYY